MISCVISYFHSMKKVIFVTFGLISLLFGLTACAARYDYTQHLSEVKRDIFLASTEEFSVTLSCISREHPYASDGISCPMTSIGEVTLVAKSGASSDYSVYVLGEETWGGEMSFRSVEDDWFYSASMQTFPQNTVTLRVEWEDETREFVATSVKNEHTMSAEEALEKAIEHEKDYIARLTQDGVFEGEFRVRLLRRDVNYYYVGIVAKDGSVLALLLNAESGEVLARREPA